MTQANSVVAIYDTYSQAEETVKDLQESGVDMKKLSILGRDRSEEHATAYYSTGDRMMYRGTLGAVWGGFWGMLLGSAAFAIPGIGPVLVAGPLVAWIIGALEGAVVMVGLTAIGAGLISIGIPKDSVVKYESALKADKFIVVADSSRSGHGQGHQANLAPGLVCSAWTQSRSTCPAISLMNFMEAPLHLNAQLSPEAF
jgi:uncharacterized membrane protein